VTQSKKKKLEISPEQAQTSTLPPPLSSQKIQQPSTIISTQLQEPVQAPSGKTTTVVTGETGIAAMTTQPAGTHAEKSLEEMEKDLDAMEQQLRKLGGARSETDQKSAIV